MEDTCEPTDDLEPTHIGGLKQEGSVGSEDSFEMPGRRPKASGFRGGEIALPVANTFICGDFFAYLYDRPIVEWASSRPMIFYGLVPLF
ncbi:hypothetical protein GCM10027299_49960 [Larkinella ripae]